MRASFLIAAALAILTCGAAVHAAEIPQGSHLLLRMVNSLNTRTAQEGDYVYLTAAAPVIADGKIVVPLGAYVQGVVSLAKRSGRVAGRAELGIRLETLTLPGGQTFRFKPRLSSVDAAGSGQKVERGENQIEQGAGHGGDAARIAILAGSGASIGALAGGGLRGAGIGAGVGGAVGLATVLVTRGKEVELRRGATLDVAFDRAVSLD
ncbi:MAG: hypothetical protein ABI165_18940 [Bryobacteraceae bacterium]